MNAQRRVVLFRDAKRYLFPIVLLIITILMAMPAISSSVFAQILGEQPSNVEALGIISGTVTDEDGNPLAGIQASARRDSGWFSVGAGNSLTNADGIYRIGGLKSGIYDVEFADPTGYYLPASHYDANRGKLPVSGNHIESVDVSLRVGGQISGAFNSNGMTISQEIVVIIYSEGRSTIIVRSVYPALSGEYTTPALPAGNYRICARATIKDVNTEECYGSLTGSLRDAALIEVTSEKTTPAIDFSFGNPEIYGGLSGIVVDGNGNPLADIRVTAESQVTSEGRSVQTSSEGEYLFPLLRQGAYELRFVDYTNHYLDAEYIDSNGTNLVTVEAGLLTTDIDMTLELGGRIEGRIAVAGNRPFRYARIEAYLADNSSRRTVASAEVDSTDGSFTLTGFDTVTVILKATVFHSNFNFDAAETFYGGATAEEATRIDVTPGSTVENIEIPVVLPEPIGADSFTGVLQGQVTADGLPLEGIHVNLHSGHYRYPAPIYTITTDADGKYTIEGLIESTRRISFEDISGMYATLFSHDKYTYASSDRVTLPGDGVLVVDAELQRVGSFSGRVRHVDGTPLTDVSIAVERVGDNGQRSLLVSLTPDDGGKYSMTDIVPGQYVLSVLAPGFDFRQSDEEGLLQRTFVTVLPGQAAVVDDAVVGAGVPLSLELVSEPSATQSIFIPFTSR